jgi:hypothetical protein
VLAAWSYSVQLPGLSLSLLLWGCFSCLWGVNPLCWLIGHTWCGFPSCHCHGSFWVALVTCGVSVPSHVTCFVAGVLHGLRSPRGDYVVPALPVCIVRPCSFVVCLAVLLVCFLSWVRNAPFDSGVCFLPRVCFGVEFRVGDNMTVAGVSTRFREYVLGFHSFLPECCPGGSSSVWFPEFTLLLLFRCVHPVKHFCSALLSGWCLFPDGRVWLFKVCLYGYLYV